MMPDRIIRTVMGDISPDKLGFCDCHCHPLILSDHLLSYNPDYFNVRDLDIAERELMEFKRAGGRSLTDCQPIGTGRATVEDVELSKRTGLNIISCTGFHMKAFYPDNHWTFTSSVDELTEIYVLEITSGMYINTEESFPYERISAKAGFIKNATEESDFDDIDKKRLTAAANASIKTGAPLLCHTNKSALTHIPFLLDCGVEPESIIVAHLDKSNLNPNEYHYIIAELGVYLEFDSIVNSRRNTLEEETDLILKMIDKGYSNKLMFGSDPVRAVFKSYNNNGWGLGYIAGSFLDILRERGITDKEIEQITVINPGKAFSFAPKIL